MKKVGGARPPPKALMVAPPLGEKEEG